MPESTTLRMLGPLVTMIILLSGCAGLPHAPASESSGGEAPAATAKSNSSDGSAMSMDAMTDGETMDMTPPGHDLDTSGARNITVDVAGLAYKPNKLMAMVNETVNITMVNRDYDEHELVIKAYSFHLHAMPGETVWGALIADKPGNFTFECDVPGHAMSGMTGTLDIMLTM